MSTRDVASAARYGSSILSVDLSREDVLRRLMGLYAATSERAAAVRLYLTFRQKLADELNVEPERETLQLYERLVAGGDESPAAEVAEAHADQGSLPYAASTFVGCEAELAQMCDLVRRGRVVTLVGPGGVGKTRSAIEVAMRSRGD